MANSVWKMLDNGASKTDQWQYDTGTDALGICVDDSGNVYVAGARSGSKSVWKLNSSGTKVWDYDTGADAHGICVDNNGFVYVAGVRNSSKSVWCLDDAGATVTLEWDADTGADTNRVRWHSNKVVVAGDQVQDGSNYKCVWCLDDSDGSEKWVFKDANNNPAYDICLTAVFVGVARDASGTGRGAFLKLDWDGVRQISDCERYAGNLAYGIVVDQYATQHTLDSGDYKTKIITESTIEKTQVIRGRFFLSFKSQGAWYSNINGLWVRACWGYHFGCPPGGPAAEPHYYAIAKQRNAQDLYVAVNGTTSLKKFTMSGTNLVTCTYKWGHTALVGRDVCVDDSNYVYLAGDRV